MKNLKQTAIALLLIPLILPMAAIAGGGGLASQGPDLPALFAKPQGQALSDLEEKNLLFSREEEKIARDVYLSLFEKWELPIFANISASESTHMRVVLDLILRYKLTDPVGDAGIGEFSSDALEELYGDLVEAGSQSPTGALLVGVLIEEMDIFHLREHIDHAEHTDLETVYENIMRGSRNHLRSFWGELDPQTAEDYVPLFLTKDEILTLANSPMETGNGGGRR